MYDDVTDETLATAVEMLVASRDEDEIAEALVDFGCQGTVGDAFRCPVARYFQVHFGRPVGYRFSVNGSAATAYRAELRHADGETWTELLVEAQVLDLPDVLRRFITEFDDEEYPYLVAR
jgi:hypothetical protein